MSTEPGATDESFSVLIPDWPLPPGVRSVITTRPDNTARMNSTAGSDSTVQADNLPDDGRAFEPLLGFPASMQSTTAEYANHYVKQVARVESARGLLASQLGLSLKPQWLQQEHGTTVIEAPVATELPIADASFTRTPGLACVVLTADCLPLLLSTKDGSLVAAIHGGWRGLACGIVAATVSAMAVDPGQIMAYLGPAISSEHFEVGPEVRQSFLDICADGDALIPERGEIADCFRDSEVTAGHYLADLYALARIQLKNLGIVEVYGGEYCTYAQSSRFYSHRRGRDVGRMASLIWIDSQASSY